MKIRFNTSTFMLIAGLSVFGMYTYTVYHIATVISPAYGQIEVNDLNIRLENCQWQLLERNAEIETLTKKLELDSLINQ